MSFLENPPRFLFFTGKGGVGKTSLASATAVALAESGQTVLLVSTDPASNIGQVLGLRIGNQITCIPDVPHLSALEIDPHAAAQAYRDRIVKPVQGILPDAVVRSIEEQLSGACTTEIAAFDEFTALLTENQDYAAYDHIIFDTAPTGHTIRLLQLPGAWSGFLETGKGNASCLGPLAGLEKQRIQYQTAVDALTHPTKTRFVFVTRAQTAALKEVARTYEELKTIGITQPVLAINGYFPEAACAGDPLAEAIFKREQAALAQCPASLLTLPTTSIPLQSRNLVGLEALRALLQPSPPSIQTPKQVDPLHAPTLATCMEGLTEKGHGLIMVMGKGGVGKTTLAAAMAVELAQNGAAVHLTTSDPAAHLTDTLQGILPTLTVSRIDPKIETERYRESILNTKGKHLDAEGRALLEEDLRSPCTEEIAVFQAFSRIIREAGKKYVVMDTAPTGHTLLLLDATGAYHREIARQMGDDAHYTTPMMRLQDPQQTKVFIATLAETTPVLEAAHLQADLRRAGIEPWAWIINNSLAATHCTAPLLCERAQSEYQEIENIAKTYAHRYAVVPLLAEEPIGITRLQHLIHPEGHFVQ